MEPALVAENERGKLDHLCVDCVIRRDLAHQLRVAGLNVGQNRKVRVNALLQLRKGQVSVFNARLIHAASVAVPQSPPFLLPLLHEIVDVVVGAITKYFQQSQLLLSASVRLDFEALRTVDEVLLHADLQSVFDDVVVEAPRIKLLLPGELVTNAHLQLAHLFRLGIALDFSVDLRVLGFDFKHDSLLVRIHVQLEQVLPHQLVDSPLVAFNFVLHSHNFWVAQSV